MKELIEEYNKKRAELEVLFYNKKDSALQEVYQEFFEQCPEVDKIQWCQYTPYFNDGDPCTFNVGDLYATLKGDEFAAEEGSTFSIGEWVTRYADEGHEWAKQVIKEYANNVSLVKSKERLQEIDAEVSKLNSFIISIEDFLPIVYGDGVEIIVRRDSVEINHYDHE